MNSILYLDCFSGISGDMALGALCDLGVTPAQIEAELARLSLGRVQLHFERQTRQGISGVKFCVEELSPNREHAHMQYAQIRQLIGESPLLDFVR